MAEQAIQVSAGSPSSGERSGRSRRRRAVAIARTALFAAAGGVIGLLLAADVRKPIGPFTASFSARPSTEGRTLVSLAPLGTMGFDTHDGPVSLFIRVDELRPEEAEAIARDPAILERFEQDVVADARSAIRSLAVRAVLAGMLGCIGAGLASALAWRSVVVGGTVGSVLLSGVLAATLTTWRPEALAEPRYTGLLTMAPTAIGDVEAVIQRFGQYRAQLAELVENVVTLYGAAGDLPTFDPSRATTRVLHVSDIHLNPQAFDLMRRLVPQFDVDAIVDTGDTTDWGTEPESQLLGEIATLGVPYVWVRGNHDSERTQQAVADQPNSVVLDGEARDVAGLRVWGIGDERYTPDKSQPVGKDVERAQAAAAAPGVARRLRESMPPRVDVVLVHDARMAVSLGGLTPLILAGHSHEPRHSTIGRATLLVEGSTGGGGLRGLQGETPEPLTCSVLYFNPTTKALVAYDRVAVEGLGQTGVNIQRHIIGRPPPPPSPVESLPSTTGPASPTSTTTSTTSTTAP